MNGTLSPIETPALGRGSITIGVPSYSDARILAIGAESRASVCVYHGHEALMYSMPWSLREPDHFRGFLATLMRIRSCWPNQVDLIAHDMHPLYLSSQYASQAGLPAIAVQHHHAHVVAVMTDNGVDGRVVGICCDGLGYGSDGQAWGCEIMICEASAYSRAATLSSFPLIGVDAAAVQTWRPAAALLWQAYGAGWREHMRRLIQRHRDRDGIPTPADLDIAARLLDHPTLLKRTSSLGRVFDGVSFLLGLCHHNLHEGDAAVALEQAAVDDSVEPYRFETTGVNGCASMSIAPIIRGIVRDLDSGQSPRLIASRFHETIVQMLAATAQVVARRAGLHHVVLAGGCFANQYLRTRLRGRLEASGFRVVLPKRIPFGDGGLALGQAIAAGAMHQQRTE